MMDQICSHRHAESVAAGCLDSSHSTKGRGSFTIVNVTMHFIVRDAGGRMVVCLLRIQARN